MWTQILIQGKWAALRKQTQPLRVISKCNLRKCKNAKMLTWR